ncbi:MAG: hypothetical protein RR346_10505 [Bacteroidales bacterium]
MWVSYLSKNASVSSPISILIIDFLILCNDVSLSSVSEEKIRIKVQDTYYTIESDSKVKGISTYSGTGALIDTKSINDTSFQIEKRKDENMIVIISFETGMTKSLKLM